MRGYFRKRNYIDDKTGEARKTSTWVVAYDLPREPGEPRRQAFKSGFRTRRDAEAWFTQKAEELRQGIAPPDERMTVEQYLKQWLESISDSVSASALHAYRNHVELHIIPALGKVRLTELRAQHIERAKAQWRSSDLKRRKGKVGKLSARTTHHIFCTLRDALNRAKRQRMIAINPCDLVDPPKVERKEMKHLNAQDSVALLRALGDSDIGAAITVSLGAGVRRGELLALRWGDIDLDAGVLSVQNALERDGGITRLKPPKTESSRRTIILPRFVVDRLRRHRIEQTQRFPANVAILQTPETLVFERNGKSWVPNTFTTAFMRALREAGVKRVRLHDLRHSYASLLLESGVDLKTVSMALGHSSVATTANIYAHVTHSLKRDAADRLDNAITTAMQKAPRVS